MPTSHAKSRPFEVTRNIVVSAVKDARSVHAHARCDARRSDVRMLLCAAVTAVTAGADNDGTINNTTRVDDDRSMTLRGRDAAINKTVPITLHRAWKPILATYW